jgi:hypothetical protein
MMAESDQDLARRLQQEELAAHEAVQARRQQVVQQTNEIALTIRGSPRCVAIVITLSIIEVRFDNSVSIL